MPTNSIFECRRFCDAIVVAGGEIPDILQRLLNGVDLIDNHAAGPAPVIGLVGQLADGRLDAEGLAAAVEEAARQKMIADFAGGPKPAVEAAVVARFHKELARGAADLVLDSMRSSFDTAAAAIARAKSVLGSGESSLEHVLNSADESDDVVGAWRSLPQHLAKVAQIAGIGAMFGVRQTASFSLIKAYGLADNSLVDDRALACTTGGLVGDSKPMLLPDRGGTDSPYYRAAGLRLWSVEEMRQRYASFAASEFDRVHDRPRSGRVIDGVTQLDEAPPKNPYRETAKT